MVPLGTEIIFRPGSIHGGEVDFDCGLERGIGYFLEPIMVLAPFSKYAFRLTLEGITAGNDLEHSLDSLKNIGCRILSWFGATEGIDFKIHCRGAPPAGGGKVAFTCPILPALTPINLPDSGLIKKIRGVASTTRVSPQVANRLIEKVRNDLGPLINDVYISSDVCKGEEGGNSSGYSLYLQAETTTGALLSAEGIGISNAPVEEMATKTVKRLIKQIKGGGMVSQSHQWMILLLMAFSPPDLCKCVLGPLSEHTYDIMEDIKVFTRVSFKVRPGKEDEQLISCIGLGMMNLNRRTN